MSKLADNAIILIISKFLSSFGTIIAGMILVRCLSKNDYGTFFQMNLITNTLVVFALWGISSSIFYFVPQLSKEQIKSFIIQSLLILFIFSGIVACGIYAFQNNIFNLINNPNLAKYVFLIGIIIIGKTLTEAVEPIFITTGKTIYSGYVNIGYIIVLISTYFFLWRAGYGLEAILLSLAACLVIKSFIGFIYTFKLPGHFYISPSAVTLTARLKFSAPLGLGRIARLFSRNMDQFVISGLYSPANFAIYNRGAMELPIISIIVQNISNVLLPRLVYLKKEDRLKDMIVIWHGSIKKVIVIGTGFFMFFFFFAEEFIVLLFTDQYLASTPIFKIYLLAIPIQVTTYGIMHQAFGNTKMIFYINLAIMVLNVIFNIIFYKLFGFIGPAIGTIATTYFFNLFHLYIIRDYFNMAFSSIYPWGYHFKLILIGSAGILPTFALKYMELPNFIKFISGFFIFIIMYFGCLLIFHILDKDDKDYIKSWLNPKLIKSKLIS